MGESKSGSNLVVVMLGNGKEELVKSAMMVVEDVIWWKAKTLKKVVVGI